MSFDHDELFRHTYAQPAHAAALLRGVLPPLLADAIDWPALRLLPGSSVDEHLVPRHVDLLFEATIGKRPLLLYLLLEHKSTAERMTAWQLLRYVLRCYDRHRELHPTSRSLPPIVPIVVHHGERPWSTARSLRELVDLAGLPDELRAALLALQPDLPFLLDDLAGRTEHELLARRETLLHCLTGLCLRFVRGSKHGDPAHFVLRWHEVWQALWRDERARPGLIALFSYLSGIVEAPADSLARAASLIHEDARTMGKTIADRLREQGQDRGRAEGMATLLLRQLELRFGPLDPTTEGRVRAAAPADLERWAERVLSADRLADVLA